MLQPLLRWVTHRVSTVREVIRSVLLLVTVGTVGFGSWLAVSTWDNYESFRRTEKFEVMAYTEPVKAAVAIKVDSSKGLAQATVVLVGVLWGLIITKREERVLLLSNSIELTAFLVANVLLLASLYLHAEYTGAVAAGHTVAADPTQSFPTPVIMDFQDVHVASFYDLQMWFLIGGVVLTASALFSVHMLPTPEVHQCAQ